MNTPLSHIGELGTMMVPARPILHDLINEDAGERLDEVMNSPERRDMIQHGLCGLLYPDIAHLDESHKANFLAAVEESRGRLYLSMLAPKNALDSASLDRLSNAGTSIVAGIAYAPTKVEHTRQLVQTVLDRSDVMNENPHTDEISIVFQGGARISDEEYEFAKLVGMEIARYGHAPKKFITGGGRGIMRAPHKGAQLAEKITGIDDTTACGISCGKIIAAEPPNKLVKKLAVFEKMERRLEAFTRSGQLTAIFPGGTGTFEEMLYVLAVLMEEKNRGIHYSFLLAGDPSKREHYEVLLSTLEATLGKDVIDQAGLRDRIAVGTVQHVAKRIIKETETAQKARRLEMLRNPTDTNIRMDFHGGIHIPSGLRVPFEVTRENVAALQLDREQSPRDRIVNLRRMIYTATCVCVSTEREEVEKNGPFEVSGDPQFLDAMQELMDYFVATKRLNGGAYREPFKIAS